MYTRYQTGLSLKHQEVILYSEMYEFPFVNKEGITTHKLKRILFVYDLEIKGKPARLTPPLETLLIPPLMVMQKPSPKTLTYYHEETFDTESYSPPLFKRPNPAFYQESIDDHQMFYAVRNLDPAQWEELPYKDIKHLGLLEYYDEDYIAHKATLAWMKTHDVAMTNAYQQEIENTSWLQRCYRQVQKGL